MAKRKFTNHTATIADALSDAIGELTSLAEEAREVCDNMPESLQQSSRYEALDNAASELEGIQEPDVPDALGAVEVKYSQEAPRSARRGLSRNSRVANAVAQLEAVWEKLDEMCTADENNEEADGLRSDVDDIKGTAEGVEFPGMYG